MYVFGNSLQRKALKDDYHLAKKIYMMTTPIENTPTGWNKKHLHTTIFFAYR